MATPSIEGVDGKRAPADYLQRPTMMRGGSRPGWFELGLMLMVSGIMIAFGVMAVIVMTFCKILEKLISLVIKP